MNIVSFKGKTPSIGSNSVICNSAIVIGDVNIGEYSIVLHNSVIRGDLGCITIGNTVNIQDLVSISSSIFSNKTFNVKIGNNVSIESKVILRGCNIGNNCLIGLNSIIMDGVEVGDNSIITANSFLPKFKKFLPNSLISGNPAKSIRPLIQEELDSVINNKGIFIDLKNAYINMDN